MKTTTTYEITDLPIFDLIVHPALEDFPSLSTEQLVVLQNSIEQKGILEPLICTPSREVFSGRARLYIAKVLNLPTAPVMIRSENDILGFAIESRIARGQITKSGIALVLFEKHSNLAPQRVKAGRPKKAGTQSPLNEEPEEPESYRALATRYQVDKKYFSLLRKMWLKMEPEEWGRLRKAILEDEVPITRAHAGFSTGNPLDGDRGPIQLYFFHEDGQIDPHRGTMPKALTSLRNGLRQWHDVPHKVKAAFVDDWKAIISDLPTDVAKITAEIAAKAARK